MRTLTCWFVPDKRQTITWVSRLQPLVLGPLPIFRSPSTDRNTSYKTCAYRLLFVFQLTRTPVWMRQYWMIILTWQYVCSIINKRTFLEVISHRNVILCLLCSVSLSNTETQLAFFPQGTFSLVVGKADVLLITLTVCQQLNGIHLSFDFTCFSYCNEMSECQKLIFEAEFGGVNEEFE